MTATLPQRRSDLQTALLLLALLLAASGLAGCGHRLTPPANVSDSVPVYVVDYGRHASLALPQRDAETLSEWSWGDWNWFALEETGVLQGFEALFASRGATLSRRVIAPADSLADLQLRLGAEEVLALEVERSRAAALEAQLETRWHRRRTEAVTGTGGRVFVPDEGRYSLGNNSVHELNRWLRALGVEVEGSGVVARYRVVGGEGE